MTHGAPSRHARARGHAAAHRKGGERGKNTSGCKRLQHPTRGTPGRAAHCAVALKMNSVEFCDEEEGNTCLILEISHHRKRAKSGIVKVETSVDDDDVLDCSMTARADEKHALDTSFNLLPHSNKRKQTYLVCDEAGSEQEIITSFKKRPLVPEQEQPIYKRERAE